MEEVIQLDEMFRRPMRSLCVELGVPLVVAAEAVDEEGLLREEYWGENWSHANDQWGASVVRALANVVEL